MLGELPEPDRDQFEEHFFNCRVCADHVRSYSQFSANAIPVLAEMDQANPAAKPEKKRSWFEGFSLWPSNLAFAGLSLSAFVVMGSVIGYQAVELRNQNTPQAVVSAALHPQTRGDETVIAVPKLGPFLLLEADVPIAAEQLKWMVRSVNSPTALMEGSAAAPQDGASLKLLLPASRFQPGEYILLVRSNQVTGTITPEKEASYRVRIGNN